MYVELVNVVLYHRRKLYFGYKKQDFADFPPKDMCCLSNNPTNSHVACLQSLQQNDTII